MANVSTIENNSDTELIFYVQIRYTTAMGC